MLPLSRPLVAQNSAPVATEFEKLHFRSIGPAIMSGRISDLAVYEANPAIWYVGTAHGGVWKTTSNGATFTPLLQDRGLLSIGDVAVSQTNPDLVWVGTGESNNRQSTSWGDGVWKSSDGGKTFANMGLKDSKHINRIVISSSNNDDVLVAATGPLFGPGGDRGIYKTTDGGKSWKLVLKGDENTGANDLVQSFTDPKVMFASLYQRRRTACCMNGGGAGSALYKSVDGGDTWTKVTGTGFPTGPLGRIAVDIYRGSANIVYAEVEGPLANASTGLYRSDDGGGSWRKVSSNNPRPMYFSQVRIDPRTPDRVYQGGVKMQLTIDGGKTFATDASLVIHDDIHAIWIDPNNPDHVLIGGDGGLGVSYDGAKTWIFHANMPVGLFYHVSYDMSVPYNVCGGMQDNYDWCGPSQSRQMTGILNHEWYQVQGGDGFEAVQDLRDNRIVYTESQDGNLIRRNKVTGESKSIRPNAFNVSPAPASTETFRFQWDTPLMLSPNDPGILLVGANKLFKSTDRGDSWTAISPDLTKNENRDSLVTMGVKGADITISKNDGIVSWSTLVTIAESKKQAGVYYTGSDDGVLSVSRDGGAHWENITKNLSGFPEGAFISEAVASRFDAGTVYITVDNHRLNDYNPYIWVSTDFGRTFKSIVNNLSGEVARTLTEDQRNPDVLYIGTETGIFLSLDRGKSWRRLKANLPTVRVDEITLHPRDNAMIVATHGRALWILDHLEPIQEYTANKAPADAKLYSVPSALQLRRKNDQNAEFWGHQYFIGENPPADAMIQFQVNRLVTELGVRISESGNVIRKLTVPANRNAIGIQIVCWDMRVEPITPDSASGGVGAAAAGRGGRAGATTPAVPGVPGPVPSPGYLPTDQCAATPGAVPTGRSGGGFFGGGGASVGPMMVPGTYAVELLAGGKVIDSKPLTITMDPEVRLAGGARSSYNALAMELHEAQRRAQKTANALSALATQFSAAATKMKDTTVRVPADVKAKFDALSKELDSARVKFGVGPVVAAGRGAGAGAGAGGGGGRGGSDQANVLGRVTTAKNNILAIFESPRASVVKQANEAKAALPKAIAEANTVLAKAAAMSATLKPFGVTLTVPATAK
jgi:photosystem II stability/assembly factor-like uncharacterized protein